MKVGAVKERLYVALLSSLRYVGYLEAFISVSRRRQRRHPVQTDSTNAISLATAALTAWGITPLVSKVNERCIESL